MSAAGNRVSAAVFSVFPVFAVSATRLRRFRFLMPNGMTASARYDRPRERYS